MAIANALCPQRFAQRGFTCVRGLVSPESILDRIRADTLAHAATVMRRLEECGGEIGIGSAQGFHELVQRSLGRFDVPMCPQSLERHFPNGEAPWLPLVRQMLGPTAEPSFAGLVFAKPGCKAQQWHIDSPHEAESHLPPHALNVLVAVEPVPLEAGPTWIAAETHRLSNHLARTDLRDLKHDLLYQSELEVTPEMLFKRDSEDTLEGKDAIFFEPLEVGDVLIFDDRILHKGGANKSSRDRNIVYFGYHRPRPNVENTHFEATRSLLE